MMILETQQKLAQVFTPEQASILAEVIEQSYRDLVKIGDFNELKAIVKELAEQQKQTSTEVKTLSQEMKSLAEQQKRTSAEVKELAEQQKRTSAEVRELAEQQKRTSVEVRELAEQQKKAWIAIEALVKESKKTRQELGGLSTTVGYRLEDQSYKALPHLLQRDFNMQVIGNIKRGYLRSNKGQPLEINILGKIKRGEQEFLLVGEAKSQLSKKYIDDFIRKKLQHITTELPIFSVLVTYMITEPQVETYARDKEITLYYSFDF